MMQSEFEERTCVQLCKEDWEIVETVYTYHPSIDEVKGKDQVAQLFDEFGMRILHDMYTTACISRNIQTEIYKKRQELNTLQEQLTQLKDCER